jgi:hypothetical protein
MSDEAGITQRAPLEPRRAFVVQLRNGIDPLAGRVEHIVSARSTPFVSLAELLTFMTEVLAGLDRSGASPTDPVQQDER